MLRCVTILVPQPGMERGPGSQSPESWSVGHQGIPTCPPIPSDNLAGSLGWNFLPCSFSTYIVPLHSGLPAKFLRKNLLVVLWEFPCT